MDLLETWNNANHEASLFTMLLIENVTTDIAANRRLLDSTQEASGNGRLPGPSPLCNGFYEESPGNGGTHHHR